MTEGTEREPHQRRYHKTNDQSQKVIAYVEVNDHGIVEITEEFLDQLLRATGHTEITDEDAQ